ncbi:MAG: transporter [Moraxellaceae bacterium]
MQNQWKRRNVLALSLGLIMANAAVYAAEPEVEAASAPVESASAAASTEQPSDTVAASEGTTATADTATAPVSPEATSPATPAATTPSMVVPPAAAAADALKQQATDASASKNLTEVFTAAERSYSLSKTGSYSLVYDLSYTYYRDSRLDLALDDGSSTLTRLRIEEDAQHTVSNTFSVQYGLLNNLTLTASLPFIAKSDLLKDTTTVGLGDIAFGARWEPFPLERGKLPLILNGSLSTKTGDSPYEINPNRDLSTGKGYYSIGGGASTRKFIDPIVLFGSGSLSYGFEESDLNQRRGSRILDDFAPGISGGISLGFAYSLNYDVSLTMSYQQSFATGSEFTFTSGESSSPADQTSSSLGISLGVRVSPKTIVNTSIGFGLTEDAPDVSLGVSFPLDFLGIGREVK